MKPSLRSQLLLIAIFSVAWIAACGTGERSWESEPLSPPTPSGALYPSLAADGADLWLSWLEEPDDAPPSIRVARLGEEGWSGPFLVQQSDNILVNWADFPSLAVLDDGTLAVQWLVEAPAGQFGYGARIGFSRDQGQTWSEPVRIHDDRDGGSEHGFVSLVAEGAGRLGSAWLDGRSLSSGGEMELRYRQWQDGSPGPERLLDDDVCTCCNTAGVRLAGESWFAYRDHSSGEIRDIRITEASSGRIVPVSDDGWEIAACPVNGPGLAVAGDRLIAAWYTEAPPEPRVQVAFSDDGGRTFGEPLRVDDGSPVGRVDVAAFDSGDAVVVWMERKDSAAEIRWRRIGPDGAALASQPAGPTKLDRTAGFPRAVAAGDSVYVVWRRPPHPWSLAMIRLGVR